MFGINARSIFRFSNAGNGVATRTFIDHVQGDGTGKLFWVDNTGSNVEFKFGTGDHQGQDNSAVDQLLAAANTIQIDVGASNVTIQGDILRSELITRDVVAIANSAKGSSTIIVNNVRAGYWGCENGTYPLVFAANSTGGLNNVKMANWFSFQVGAWNSYTCSPLTAVTGPPGTNAALSLTRFP